MNNVTSQKLTQFLLGKQIPKTQLQSKHKQQRACRSPLYDVIHGSPRGFQSGFPECSTNPLVSSRTLANLLLQSLKLGEEEASGKVWLSSKNGRLYHKASIRVSPKHQCLLWLHVRTCQSFLVPSVQLLQLFRHMSERSLEVRGFQKQTVILCNWIDLCSSVASSVILQRTFLKC